MHNPIDTQEDIAAARECLAREYSASNFMAFAGTPGGITYRRDEAALRAMLAFAAQTPQPEGLASVWTLPADKMPPLDTQVLVELREGPGQVCDVACYAGKFPVEGGGTEDRWIMSDVRLDTRQIKRWAHIYPLPPRDEIQAAVDAALAAMPLASCGVDREAVFERDDQCNVEFRTVPDCDCPHEHWHVNGICLDVHIEEDRTGHIILTVEDDPIELSVAGVADIAEARSIAFAWSVQRLALAQPLPTPPAVGDEA